MCICESTINILSPVIHTRDFRIARPFLVALLYPFAARALLTGLLLVEGGCRVVKSNRMFNPGMTGFPKENEQCLTSNRKHR